MHKCAVYIRYKAETSEQLMGQLPVTRVISSHPFYHTGVAYAGPIQIKVSKGSKNKSYEGYIAVFVRMATKGIHVEIVSDVTSDAFLAAFCQFAARKGQCLHMYSVSAMTFLGDSNVLQKEVAQIIKSSEIQDTLLTVGTQ